MRDGIRHVTIIYIHLVVCKVVQIYYGLSLLMRFTVHMLKKKLEPFGRQLKTLRMVLVNELFICFRTCSSGDGTDRTYPQQCFTLISSIEHSFRARCVFISEREMDFFYCFCYGKHWFWMIWHEKTSNCLIIQTPSLVHNKLSYTPHRMNG